MLAPARVPAASAAARSSAPVRSRSDLPPRPLGDQGGHARQNLRERRLVEAFGERRQELVRRGTIPVDQPVGESVSTPAGRLEHDRRHRRRGHRSEHVRSIATAHDAADPRHDHPVDRRDRGCEARVDEGAVRHDLDTAEVMPEQRDRRGQREAEHQDEQERDPERITDPVDTERAGRDRDHEERGGENPDERQPPQRLPVGRGGAPEPHDDRDDDDDRGRGEGQGDRQEQVSATDDRPGSRDGVGDRFALPAAPCATPRPTGRAVRSRTAATAVTAGVRRGTRAGTGRSPAIPSRPGATSSATGSRSRAPCDPLGGRPSWPHRCRSSPRARDRSAAAATRRRSAGAATRSDRRPPRNRPPPRGRARSRPGPSRSRRRT